MRSPTVANDLRFNYSRTNAISNLGLDSFGGAEPLTTLGFPSPYDAQQFPTHFRYFLADRWFSRRGIDSAEIQRQINLVDNISVQAGSHSLKFGVDFRRLSPITKPFLYSQFAGFGDVPSAESWISCLQQLGGSGQRRVPLPQPWPVRAGYLASSSTVNSHLWPSLGPRLSPLDCQRTKHSRSDRIQPRRSVSIGAWSHGHATFQNNLQKLRSEAWRCLPTRPVPEMGNRAQRRIRRLLRPGHPGGGESRRPVGLSHSVLSSSISAAPFRCRPTWPALPPSLLPTQRIREPSSPLTLISSCLTPLNGMSPLRAVPGTPAKVIRFICRILRTQTHSVRVPVLSKPQLGSSSLGWQSRHIGLQRFSASISAAPLAGFSGVDLLHLVALDR